MHAIVERRPSLQPQSDTISRAPAQFFVPATASLHERRPRTLKHGDTFALFDHSGDAIGGPGSPEGLYHRDTRHLSHFYLTMEDGARPILLSSALRDDNATLTCDLTNPDFAGSDGRHGLKHDLIHIRRTRFLWDASLFERLTICNYDDKAHSISLRLEFGADFLDLFEVRGTSRDARGHLRAPQIGRDQVVLAYEGLDGMVRETSLRFAPLPQELAAAHAVFTLTLAPQERQTLLIRIRCGQVEQNLDLRQDFAQSMRQARRALQRSSGRAASLVSSNETVNETLRRCVADTYMLVTDTEHGPFPYAGIPWFSTVFGRDSIITAMEMLWLDPGIARGVLSFLAAHQATAFDPDADAEPGKILHEVRRGEMAILGEVPFRHYYGSIDSTPLFIMLAGQYLERTGDLGFIRSIWPQIEAALGWIDNHGDRDGDGYVEYGRYTDQGLANQGWKDSYDSVFHADGSLARGPVALAEVQAYVYGAWMAAATILDSFADSDKAAMFREKASALQERFDRAFFDEALGTYVLALDGDKRPCRVRSSNAGQVLFTGLARQERVPRLIEALMSPSSFSGWGIRTIPTTEARYNPMSYHNGSVWPHDNALIAAGFARYGFRAEAALIFEGLMAASTYVDLRRLPELFCGFPRRPAQGPTLYPVACVPQAWAAAAPLFLLQSCLGLSFDPQAERILFAEPTLPGNLDELLIRHIQVGNGQADVVLRRSGRKVMVDVPDRIGNVRVLSLT
ncbi:amylo-alpha-1,6-glucosidase [Sphingobium scionense]|uniref:Glycogen debranching enzyme n=1 Tax=Sphingobium scionense TaxID=1404341 RepID=A0A7W6LWG1_9SPHN|nr:amylo-alpha-1,6-glucosidase [Sphingobium scionense]MBB4150716.1 glycogen debranching enzyme [Sphingobium scionense]